MNDQAGVNVISTYQSLLSDRDSDFDCYSAYCEAIDNSIQAFATNIDVHFEPRGSKDIDYVIFSDNGIGMDDYILQRCLRLGYSSRFNDRSGIGRFGVGMTKGAIHECKRIEVYSKQKNSEWRFTYIDLDEIGEHEEADGDNTWIIPKPIPKNPHDEDIHSNLIPGDQGTIVIWKKYDRVPASPKDLLENFKIYASRTFRYFLWNINPLDTDTPFREVGELTIKINGQEIYAHDPMYVNKQKNKFPNDPPAEKFEPITIDWPINDPDLEKKLGRTTSKILINLSFTPLSWRSYQGAGNAQETKDRFIDQNEGISFIRHGREVGYDWIPHWNFQSREIDRWWSAEICFEPELDKSFTVKNIKRGAVPIYELKNLLRDKLVPFIREKREKVSADWKVDPAPKAGDPVGGSGHGLGEKIAGKTNLPKGKALSEEERNKKIAETAKIAGKGDIDQEKIWAERFKAQPFSIKDDSWPGTSFIDINHMGGTEFLQYNTRHALINTLRNIQGEIKDGINLEDNAERLNTLIDIILMAFGKAKAMIDHDQTMTGNQFQDQLINNWGAFLSSYIETWKKEYDSNI